MSGVDLKPGPGLYDEPCAQGVPPDKARLWASAGGAQILHLAAHDGNFLWEVHRRGTKQLCIIDFFGHGLPQIQALVRQEIKRARALGATLVKARLPDSALTGLGFSRMVLPVDRDAVSTTHPEQPLPQIKWLEHVPLHAAPRYLNQRTPFTCGPACLLMGTDVGESFACEIDVWRDATYGIGTDPYGLGAALAMRAIPTEIWVSRPGLLLHEQGSGSFTEGASREAIHAHNLGRAVEAGASVRIEPFTVADIRTYVAEHGPVALLIDEQILNGETAAHWILVWAVTADAFIVHDPWIDSELGETWIETSTMPVSDDELQAMAVWGGDHVMAMVTVGTRS